MSSGERGGVSILTDLQMADEVFDHDRWALESRVACLGEVANTPPLPFELEREVKL